MALLLPTKVMRQLGRAFLLILLLPIGLALLLLFLSLWLLSTLSLIGPTLQYFCRKQDEKLLDRSSLLATIPDLRFVRVPISKGNKEKELDALKAGESTNFSPILSSPNREEEGDAESSYYEVAVRYTTTDGSPYPPVCIPNGLGATMMTISPLHELLVERGFTVLSYDRLGVGLSDPNPSPVAPSADECIEEMARVLSAVSLSLRKEEMGKEKEETKWILLGPSMGSVVAQCFIAKYPERVAGFLNMDGFPYPFCMKRSKFHGAALVYKLYAALVWTGIFRPFLYFAVRSWRQRLESKAFPIELVRAEMNSKIFFSNLGKEMRMMIDLAEMAEVGWGAQSCLKLEKEALQTLVRAEPKAYGKRGVEGMWKTLPRGRAERGNDWASEDEVHAIVSSQISQEPLSPLAAAWRNLVVRVMSARSYDYAGGDAFYDEEMKDWAAAEHALHSLLAKDGARTVYSTKGHGDMFAMTEEIVRMTIEIAQSLSSATSP